MSSIFVPTDAITAMPSSTTSTSSSSSSSSTSPTLTPTTTTLPDTPSPVNAGAIAGGAIGGVVVLGAIFAFVWYMVGIRRRSDNQQPLVEQRDMGPGGYSPGVFPTEKPVDLSGRVSVGAGY